MSHGRFLQILRRFTSDRETGNKTPRCLIQHTSKTKSVYEGSQKKLKKNFPKSIQMWVFAYLDIFTILRLKKKDNFSMSGMI